MHDSILFNNLLVPVDFSPASETAFEHALKLASGDDRVVIVLHVIDTSLVEFAADHAFGSKDEVTGRMREQAEEQLAAYKQRGDDLLEVETVVSEGTPFLEILRKAEDFDVDAIVLGKIGARGALEKLLFGSTAEKVLRATRRPVVVLPIEETGSI